MLIRPIARRVAAALAVIAGILGIAAGIGPAASAYATPAYGPYTCTQGYVWRGATASDYVCVTPADRSTVADENNNAWWRTSTYGSPRWCNSGYVWREASAGDYACVPPASRDREHYNNATTFSKYVDPYDVPYGNSSVSNANYQTGAYAYLSASYLSANHTVYTYVADHLLSGSPYWTQLTTFTADASGRVNNGYLGFLNCRYGLSGPTEILVLDQWTGVLTKAYGYASGYHHCGS